jgi:hypothetical protein
VYRRGDKLLVCALSKTSDGYWLEQGPAAVVSADDAAGVEHAVLSALRRSRARIRPPESLSEWRSPVLEAAGLKRFTTFSKHAALVSIEQRDDRLSALPHRNGMSSEGYVGLLDERLVLERDSRTIWELVIRALDRCC